MHKVVKVATKGSVGDLGKVARALADAGYNIETIGGSEVHVDGASIGSIVMQVTPDEDGDDATIERVLRGADLGGGRRLLEVTIQPAFDLGLRNEPGALARAAEVLGDAGIDIQGVVLVDARSDEADVSLAFADADARDRARDLLSSNTFDVLDVHGAQGRRGG